MNCIINISSAWSSQFRTPTTKATKEQLDKIKSGQDKMPNDARVGYAVWSSTDAPVKITVSQKGPDGEFRETFDPMNSDKEGTDRIRMQGQEHGYFENSRGWNGILFCEPQSGPADVKVSVLDGSHNTASVSYVQAGKHSL